MTFSNQVVAHMVKPTSRSWMEIDPLHGMTPWKGEFDDNPEIELIADNPAARLKVAVRSQPDLLQVAVTYHFTNPKKINVGELPNYNCLPHSEQVLWGLRSTLLMGLNTTSLDSQSSTSAPPFPLLWWLLLLSGHPIWRDGTDGTAESETAPVTDSLMCLLGGFRGSGPLSDLKAHRSQNIK